MIFFSEKKKDVKDFAGSPTPVDKTGQIYTEADAVKDIPWTELGGLVWYQGDFELNNSDFGGNDVEIGSREKPVILVIEGDFKINGSPTIYGLVYVMGKLNISGGSPTVNGAMIVEDKDGSTDPAVEGTGALNICFDPDLLYRDGPGEGETGMIPGTWRDW